VFYFVANMHLPLPCKRKRARERENESQGGREKDFKEESVA
jgi:hypothetical protein